MSSRNRLFLSTDIYNLPRTNDLFVDAMRENITFHAGVCQSYRRILEHFGFDLGDIGGIDDLWKIPPLPTLYLKNNTILSKPYEKLLIKTTSSGTGGKKTLSGYDAGSALCALSMAVKILRAHSLISLRPTNYIILGVKPDAQNQTATAKALRYFTILAPAKSIVYAVKLKDGEYHLDVDGLVNAASKFSAQGLPVRIVGFPAYFKMLLNELSKRGIKLNLHKNSKILLGGGWKTFFAEEISKEELFSMANSTLGITRKNFKDHFSTAEHPVNYVACENNRFHIPVFSRVIIRCVHTLQPLANNKPGILNLITPLLSSAPYNSILTDDIATISSDNCGCGIPSPYFEVIGRVGLANMRTCTQTASEIKPQGATNGIAPSTRT